MILEDRSLSILCGPDMRDMASSCGGGKNGQFIQKTCGFLLSLQLI